MTQASPLTGLTTESLELISRAERGVVPADLASCEALLVACDRVEHAAAAIRWVAIAAARRCPELAESPTGRGRTSPWIEWVKANYSEYGNEAHIHHMGAVGDLLIRGRKVCCATTLFSLAFDKLVPIARLPEHLVVPFCETYSLADMDRDRVRRAVNQWLEAAGEPTGEEEATKGTKGTKGKAGQLDFLDVLFAQSDEGPQALYERASRRFVVGDLATARGALDRSLAVAGAAMDKLLADGTAQDLARYAESLRIALAEVEAGIANKTGIE